MIAPTAVISTATTTTASASRATAPSVALIVVTVAVAVSTVMVVSSVSIVVAVTADITDKKNAVDLVKIGSTVLGGGGGGGRSDMAQAGGPNADKAADALKAVSAAL